jgi:hypothetical protein
MVARKPPRRYAESIKSSLDNGKRVNYRFSNVKLS